MTEDEEIRKKHMEESQKMIDEWLSKGNEITVYPYGARSEEVNYTSGMYAKKKKVLAPEQKKAKDILDAKNAAAVKKALDKAAELLNEKNKK